MEPVQRLTNSVAHIHHSAIKKLTMALDRKWMNMEDLLLSEASQIVKDIVCPHLIYTKYLHSMPEIGRYKSIEDN